MDKGGIEQNRHILVYGASCTSGTFAVQYGKYLGAHVTGVCSTGNLEFVRSLGADVVMDYTVRDHIEPGIEFDFILDSVGNIKTSKLKESCRKNLKKTGFYVSIDDGDLILSSSRLDQISGLVLDGSVKPVVEKIFSA
jgi:NADPH:quinone reductase-like Zn-dependent oxidoreductase